MNKKAGLLKKFHTLIPEHLKSHSMVIITDNQVKKLYGSDLKALLEKNGFKTFLFSFPPGEKSKTRETKAKIESAMIKHHLGRDTCIIALGGGVVGDLAGFIAATYMRGIPYIQVPTTLLAIVDSSIGGKTAVNTPEGKNLIGAFYPPEKIIMDLDCLNSLSEKQLTNGWIEALKIFLIRDKTAFNKAKKNRTPNLIQKAIDLKKEIVTLDPLENGIRAVLNFGHTIGHALETLTDYKYLHGHLVGYGILVESQLSYQLGLISKEELDQIFSCFNILGIKPGFLKKFKINDIIALTHHDKKAKNSQIHYALLKGIGNHQFTIIQDHQLKQALEEIHHGR